MDPQQRLLLEVVWEALESAAINPDGLREQAAGVFIGAATQDYAKLFSQQSDENSIDAYLGIGGALSALAGRLSYSLGLVCVPDSTWGLAGHPVSNGEPKNYDNDDTPISYAPMHACTS